LLLFTTDRERYSEEDWLNGFGTVWLTYKDDTARGDSEWFAIYEGGLKVDIVLLHVDDDVPELEALLKHYPYQTVFARGIKVLFDRHGEARVLPPRQIDLPAAPTAAKFAHVVNGLLLESVTTAKFIARGDFYRAQHWFSEDLRPRLLRLIEWHAYGSDTWYNGRFLDTWAAPRVVAALPQTFALYERDSLQAALRAMLELARLVGEETAARFNFTYPLETHDKIVGLIGRILGTT
jgi:aminoglycoside 6-adenylyltransferase